MNVLKEAKNVEWHADVVKWKFLLLEGEISLFDVGSENKVNWIGVLFLHGLDKGLSSNFQDIFLMIPRCAYPLF